MDDVPKLQLVKPRTDERQPSSRSAPVSTERRYRYPAEEIWEVSEQRIAAGNVACGCDVTAGDRLSR
jgi:hypothetical protein